MQESFGSPFDPLAVLDIDLAAVADNIRQLQKRVSPSARVAGVVKADAYGIGLAEIAALHRQLGTESFFVATPEEGLRLRGLSGFGAEGGATLEIAPLCGLLPGEAGLYRHHALTPVLNSLAQIAEWEKGGGGAPAMLHLDTGMRRLGLDSGETAHLVAHPELLDGVNITVLLSHFACADEPENPLTNRQKDDFERFSAGIYAKKPGIRRSLSNSAGVFAHPACHYELVRPGMAVYGLNPVPGQENPMKSVVQLRARILQTRKALPGETIGYGATYQCKEMRSLACVALGYADGFLRSLSNCGVLFWNGRPCPVLGRVSMDVVSVDITGLTGPAPQAGDWMEVLGQNQSVDALAGQAGTIGYEILTSLGARYRRHYHPAA